APARWLRAPRPDGLPGDPGDLRIGGADQPARLVLDHAVDPGRDRRRGRAAAGGRADGPMSGRSGFPGQRAAPVGMTLGALGPPLNRPVDILVLIAVIFFALCGEVRAGWRWWLGAVVLVAAVRGALALLPDPHIEEGQNIFLIDGPDGALSRALPAN